MRDLSYLQAFDPKAIRSARRIIAKGFTVEDIDEYLENMDKYKETPTEVKEKPKSLLKRLEKPCCGEGKVDAAVAAFREKQRKKRGEV